MTMRGRGVLAVVAAFGAAALQAAEPTAEAFGAREAAERLSLSPGGTKVAFIAPGAGQSSVLYTLTVGAAADPKAALSVSGAPDRLRDCRWVSDQRLICTIWGKVKVPEYDIPLTYTRLVAVDADGRNQKMVRARNLNDRNYNAWGGDVIDWLPGQDNQILIERNHSRTDQTGTNVGSRREGLEVDRLDSATLRATTVEAPRPNVSDYITDGRGTVRIAAYPQYAGETYQATGVIRYRFRPAGSTEWQQLSDYDGVRREGFRPVAVDSAANVAYGFRKVNGRLVLFTKTLDADGKETELYSRPDVDVDDLVRLGRAQRVIGYSYATDSREVVYLDSELKQLSEKLHRALPKAPLVSIVDASTDENRLLIFAGSDTDPGLYYVYDKNTRQLQRLMQARPQLADRKLAIVKAISVPVGGGMSIPAYLTLPPGSDGKHLPAIVLPHGGPSARDEWGFDWLPQFFAARGYAVLQPNYRGSRGFGDSFQMGNGFQSWRTAIGDVAAAGRWLVAEGIADPGKLGIVGWSYGGYAALEAAVIEPDLFKAVVAIAPVTDLTLLKTERRNWTDHAVTEQFVGALPAEASPAQNAARIKAPVLLAHGMLDSNVGYDHSSVMESRLRGAGRKVEFLSFPSLDHQLEDASARATLLDHADALLRSAFVP